MTPPIESSYSGLSPFSKLTRWMNARRDARRVRQDEEKAVHVLHTMGPKLAKDIGVDINKLGTPEPTEHRLQEIVMPLRARHHDPL
jgi:hypothetical protein